MSFVAAPMLAAVLDRGRRRLQDVAGRFDEETAVTQAAGHPNHVVWTLGHCALTLVRVREALDRMPAPEHTFVIGNGQSGDSLRFDTESVCRGSTPVDDPARYPDLARAIEIHELAAVHLACLVAHWRDETARAVIPWNGRRLMGAELVLRAALHDAEHAGQLVALARALGRDAPDV